MNQPENFPPYQESPSFAARGALRELREWWVAVLFPLIVAVCLLALFLNSCVTWGRIQQQGERLDAIQSPR